MLAKLMSAMGGRRTLRGGPFGLSSHHGGAPPKSVGLGGYGDEISAIYDVERAFGVKLDYADAPGWRTAGDVFTSLQRILPAEKLNSPDLWQRFAVALCGQTDVNPNDIDRDSPLLSQSRFWVRLADASAVAWIVAFVGFLVLLAAAAS